MASNRTAFILATVRSVLSADATLTINSVHRNPESKGVAVYPYVVGQTLAGEMESFETNNEGTMTIGFNIDAEATYDTDQSGDSTDKYGEVIQKIEKLWYDWQASIADGSTRPQETHTGGLFRTAIVGCSLISWDGHFDIAKGRLKFGAQAIIYFYHERL